MKQTCVAKADNSAVFVGPDCSLLTGDEDYKIVIILKSSIGDRLTDSQWLGSGPKAMDQINSDVAKKNTVANRKFITAFFDDAEKRADYLLDLHANGHAAEAATLCLVYIDSFSQWLFWPRSRAGQNFVEALVDHGGDPEFALIHPLAAIRAFETMKAQWKNFATKLCIHFPGPKYSLFEKGDFLTEVAADFTEGEAKFLGIELWRGTIANVVYTRLRNPSVHSFRSAAEISFDSTTHRGQSVRPITFRRLHEALLKIIAVARARSMANNQWFGDDKIVKGGSVLSAKA